VEKKKKSMMNSSKRLGTREILKRGGISYELLGEERGGEGREGEEGVSLCKWAGFLMGVLPGVEGGGGERGGGGGGTTIMTEI